jgi:hypothetical protein
MFDVLAMGIHTAMVDGALHTLALGVAQHVTGNVLAVLAFDVLPGAPVANVHLVWTMVREHYALHRVSTPMRQLKLATFVVPAAPHAHYPDLKAKGKETEYLTLAVAWIWEQYADAESREHQSISMVLQSVVHCFDACREPGVRLTAVQSRSLQRAVDTLLVHYTALGNRASAAGKWRWNLTPKFHMLWHWAQQCTFVHPAASGTYMDESFVGTMKGIAQASTAGVAIRRVQSTIIAKYLRGLLLRWKRRAEQPALAPR